MKTRRRAFLAAIAAWAAAHVGVAVVDFAILRGPVGLLTGMMPFSMIRATGDVTTDDLPHVTKVRRGLAVRPFTRALRQRKISGPANPLAEGRPGVDGGDHVGVDFARRARRRQSSPWASSVTRWPWRKLALRPAFSMPGWMALPPPCTTTRVNLDGFEGRRCRARRCCASPRPASP